MRDGADGRPGLRVTATLIDAGGEDLGTHEHPLWHPMLHHYGRKWETPGVGGYTLCIHIVPPHFMRHDESNGRHFTEHVGVELTGVRAKTGPGRTPWGGRGAHRHGRRPM